MTSVILYKPCCHPDNIPAANEIPKVPPTLCRTLAMESKLPTDSREGIKYYLLNYSFVDAVVIKNDQIIVKVYIDKVDYVYDQIERIFKEGIHTLSSKIWRVSKYKQFMTSSGADIILKKNICNCCKFYCCLDSKYDYIVYVIDMR